MMWEKIKQVLDKEGGRCIIVEEGQPSYVVSKLDEADSQPADQVERVNRDINEWKEEESLTKAVTETEPENDQEVKIENLPF